MSIYIAHQHKKITPLMCSICQVLFKKKRQQCTKKTVNLHVRLTQTVLEQVPCRWSSNSEGRQPYISSWNRETTSRWRLAEQRCCVQQLERLVYTAQTDNPVPGHASTCTLVHLCCCVFKSRSEVVAEIFADFCVYHSCLDMFRMLILFLCNYRSACLSFTVFILLALLYGK